MKEDNIFRYSIATRIGIPIGVVISVLWPLIPSVIYMVGDLFPNSNINFRIVFGNVPVLAYVIVGVVWVVGAYAQFYSATHKYSIEVNEDGISAYIFGIYRRHFSWGDINKIEKQRIYVGGQFGTITYIDIMNNSHAIRFYKSIIGYDKLIVIINEYIDKFSIPIVFQDRGYDTVQAAKAATDKKDWRKLNRDGVSTNVKQL